MKLTILSVIISLLLLEKCYTCPQGYFQGRFGDDFDKCNECFCSGVTDNCRGALVGPQKLKINLNEIRWWRLDRAPTKIKGKDGFIFELPSEFFKGKASNYGGTLYLDIAYPEYWDGYAPPIDLRILSSEVNIAVTAKFWFAHSDTYLSYIVRLMDMGAYIGEDHSQPATKADVYRAMISADKIFVVSNNGGKEVRGISYASLVVPNKEFPHNHSALPLLSEVCACPKGYSGDSCESCDSSQQWGPCKNIEPCEDVCNDIGICLGCPKCFEWGSYHRNINNKTESLFGACEFHGRDSK